MKNLFFQNRLVYFKAPGESAPTTPDKPKVEVHPGNYNDRAEVLRRDAKDARGNLLSPEARLMALKTIADRQDLMERNPGAKVVMATVDIKGTEVADQLAAELGIKRTDLLKKYPGLAEVTIKQGDAVILYPDPNQAIALVAMTPGSNASGDGKEYARLTPVMDTDRAYAKGDKGKKGGKDFVVGERRVTAVEEPKAPATGWKINKEGQVVFEDKATEEKTTLGAMYPALSRLVINGKVAGKGTDGEFHYFAANGTLEKGRRLIVKNGTRIEIPEGTFRYAYGPEKDPHAVEKLFAQVDDLIINGGMEGEGRDPDAAQNSARDRLATSMQRQYSDLLTFNDTFNLVRAAETGTPNIVEVVPGKRYQAFIAIDAQKLKRDTTLLAQAKDNQRQMMAGGNMEPR